MKSVLTAIQPYYVFLIIVRLMGWNIPQAKTVEVRKDYPKDPAWNRVTHIYCSKNRKSFNRIPKQYQPLIEKLLGKVIGEFVCDSVEEFQIEGAKGVRFKRFLALAETCLTVTEMRAYAGNKPKLYGWHISELKIYDKPKELGEFITVCKIYYSNNDDKCWGCPNLRVIEGNKEAWQGDCISRHKLLTRAPQSWCYVEEL